MTHSTKVDYHGIPITVYLEEFFPLFKVINDAILMPERFALTDKELEAIIEFQDKLLLTFPTNTELTND